MTIKLGTANKDTVTGTTDWDTLYGFAGNDTMAGGDGNDVLEGGVGADYLLGGASADIFKYTSFKQARGDVIADFSTEDTIDFSAIAGASFIGNAAFSGISYMGDAAFSGIPGQYYERITFHGNKTHKLVFDFDGDKVADSTIILFNIPFSRQIVLEESAPGSNRLIIAPNKTLIGTTSNEILTGGNGYDSLNGDAGNDSLQGGAARDMLKGGGGADTLVGGLGSDTLTGGTGDDVFKYESLADLGYYTGIDFEYDPFFARRGYYNETITDLKEGDKIDLSAITGLTFVGVGKGFDDTANQVRITDSFFSKKTLLEIDTDGDSRADYGLVLPAYLSIEETAAGSMIFQVAVGKTLNGTSTHDSLSGGNGNDMLKGLNGDDSIVGGYGADTLIGGLGADTLTGGAGKDLFKYNSLAELSGHPETITDFMTREEDKIDLSAIDANPQQAGDQAFSFLGRHAFTGAGSELYYSSGTLYGDVDGDKNPDFTVIISGSTPHVSDFIL